MEPGKDHLQEFIRLFNEQAFFEAHEVLEELWRIEKGRDKDFYHGLIQIAAALLHVQRGNIYGARTLLARAAAYLSPYGAYHAISISTLLKDAEACLSQTEKNFPLIKKSY